MRQFEQAPNSSMETFDFKALEIDFDINAAFQEAMFGVATDQELVLEEKVRRMEVIVTESSSQAYRDFVDFRSIAAQMEMFCNHDHALSQAAQNNVVLSSFTDGYKLDNEHSHGTRYDKKTGKNNKIDPKTGKKKKKRSWFYIAA